MILTRRSSHASYKDMLRLSSACDSYDLILDYNENSAARNRIWKFPFLKIECASFVFLLSNIYLIYITNICHISCDIKNDRNFYIINCISFFCFDLHCKKIYKILYVRKIKFLVFYYIIIFLLCFFTKKNLKCVIPL